MVCYSSNSLACLEISFKVFPSFNAVRIVSPPLFTLHKEIFGTMIVVEDGRRDIGKTVDINVTSVLQTAAGRMIFGKIK